MPLRSKGPQLMLRHGKSAAPPVPDVPGEPPAAPLIERVVGWSTRHRALAVTSWFALMLVAVLAGALIPGPGAGAADPGESGRAERVLAAQHAYAPVLENVLIQSRTGASFTGDADLRQAARELETARQRTPGTVTGLRSPLRPGGGGLVSKDGRSGLVTFQLAGSYDRVGAQYGTVVRAVAGVAARHPRARVVQAGDRSLTSAVAEEIKNDFNRAENNTLPHTVVNLLLEYGSLIATSNPQHHTQSTVIGAFGLLQVID